nr:MAG TPA: hypothetical protein [Caudoviricetes sp.]
MYCSRVSIASHLPLPPVYHGVARRAISPNNHERRSL